MYRSADNRPFFKRNTHVRSEPFELIIRLATEVDRRIRWGKSRIFVERLLPETLAPDALEVGLAAVWMFRARVLRLGAAEVQAPVKFVRCQPERFHNPPARGFYLPSGVLKRGRTSWRPDLFIFGLMRPVDNRSETRRIESTRRVCWPFVSSARE